MSRHANAATISAIAPASFLAFLGQSYPHVVAQLPPLGIVSRTERELWDERVSSIAVMDHAAAAMQLVRRPSLPIEFGAQVRFEHLGLLGLAVRTAETVSEAVERMVRFHHLFNASADLECVATGQVVCWYWRRLGPRTLGMRFANEVSLTRLVALARQLVGPMDPLRVQFRHAAPEDDSAHRRFFRCPVEWSAPTEGIVWPAALLQRSLPPVDPAISRYFVEEAERKLAAVAPATMVERVRIAAAQRLEAADADLAGVANALGLTPRQLRAALAAEDVRFRDLIDELRRDTAKTLVESGRHSLTEVAFLLGFSEISALSRAWKRWFGEPAAGFARTQRSKTRRRP